MIDPISIRLTQSTDQNCLIRWLQQPGVLRWFPLADIREIEDAVSIWMSDSLKEGALTALWQGEPCGMAVLYIPVFQQLSSQCLFAIIVDEEKRGLGVGTRLLRELTLLAKEKFQIDLLHLEVYEGNPAMRLYERCGFVKYGEHPRFVKEEGHYLAKIMMQKTL